EIPSLERDLTDRSLEGAAPEQSIRQQGRGDVLSRALVRARLNILWERLWPALAAVATAVGVFLAVSWIGTWLWLPPIGRAIGLGVFFLLTAAAFDWQGVMVPANFRIDAWVNPPPYTGKPPVILAGLRPGEPAPAAGSALTVPAGSILIIRSSGPVNLDVDTTGGLTEAKAETKPGVQPVAIAGTEEHRFTVSAAGAGTVRSVVANDLTWQFTAIPDRPPTIALTKDPEPQLRGALQLSYKLEDDYGVVGAEATFALNPGDGTNGLPPRSLYEAPD